jgi:hypothetical protein
MTTLLPTITGWHRTKVSRGSETKAACERHGAPLVSSVPLSQTALWATFQWCSECAHEHAQCALARTDWPASLLFDSGDTGVGFQLRLPIEDAISKKLGEDALTHFEKMAAMYYRIDPNKGPHAYYVLADGLRYFMALQTVAPDVEVVWKKEHAEDYEIFTVDVAALLGKATYGK